MVRFAIIEDLVEDQKRLAALIRENCAEHGEESELAFFPDGEEFLDAYRKGMCSAVFLDIVLSTDGMSGLDTAQALREMDARIPIVFVTSEAGFALEGYSVHPLDYLLKPVSREKLEWCLNELRDFLAPPACVQIQESLGRGAPAVQRLILLDDFIFAETARHGIIVHTVSGDIASGQTLTGLQQMLPASGRFFSSGRSFLLNFSHVKNILNDGEVLLKGGGRVYCSRRKIKEAQDAFSRYLFSTLRGGGTR